MWLTSTIIARHVCVLQALSAKTLQDIAELKAKAQQEKAKVQQDIEALTAKA